MAALGLVKRARNRATLKTQDARRAGVGRNGSAAEDDPDSEDEPDWGLNVGMRRIESPRRKNSVNKVCKRTGTNSHFSPSAMDLFFF